MALYVFMTVSGELISWSPNDNTPVVSDLELTARGMSKVVGLPALDVRHTWDSVMKTVVTVDPVTRSRITNVFDWMQRFTPAELAGIRASTNAGVQKFLFLLPLAAATGIDVNSAQIRAVMTLLVNQNLLTAQRANEIVS